MCLGAWSKRNCLHYGVISLPQTLLADIRTEFVFTYFEKFQLKIAYKYHFIMTATQITGIYNRLDNNLPLNRNMLCLCVRLSDCAMYVEMVIRVSLCNQKQRHYHLWIIVTCFLSWNPTVWFLGCFYHSQISITLAGSILSVVLYTNPPSLYVVMYTYFQCYMPVECQFHTKWHNTHGMEYQLNTRDLFNIKIRLSHWFP